MIEIDEQEQAEAAALAEALDRDVALPDLPSDALEAAAFLRFNARDAELGTEAEQGIFAELTSKLETAPARTRKRMYWLWLAPAFALGAAGLLWVQQQTNESVALTIAAPQAQTVTAVNRTPSSAEVAANSVLPASGAVAPKAPPKLVAAFSGPLSGWFLAGNGPSHYRISADSEIKHGGVASACLTAVEDPRDTFGTLMQSIAAGEYRDKRVRLSAFVRTHSVSGWTGVWMRVDREEGRIPPFDNMEHRPIKGTTDWAKYEVVLDVPHDAKTINFGVAQTGPGKTWFDDVTLDAVDNSVAVTDMNAARVNAAPTNLNFDRR